jgi:hypothetical protein
MDDEYFDIWPFVVPAVGVVFAAVCIWLGVRIVNRRERWAKWMLAGVVGLPMLYVLSFGPACWIASRIWVGFALVPYRPIAWATDHDLVNFRIVCNYAQLFALPKTKFVQEVGGDCWMDRRRFRLTSPLQTFRRDQTVAVGSRDSDSRTTCLIPVD